MTCHEQDVHTVYEAARASRDIYAKDPKEFVYRRTVEQFSRITGELCAGVRIIDEGRTAIVAVRGTSLVGNWLFTNLQAYFTQFNIVDDRLSAAPAERYQGGHFRTPVPGALHQGFFRAFSWLWYGTEPVFGVSDEPRAVGLIRLRRYAFLFLSVPFFFWLATQSIVTATCLALMLAFAFVTTESGIWEAVFMRKPKESDTAPDAQQPYLLLPQLNTYERVIFTGHSLGGAIATLAFAMYRCWCKSEAGRKDNATLMTFGAPRVGDVQFMNGFHAEHEGRFCHVTHPGDPVPELPPNGLFELWNRRIWQRGLLGFVVVLLFPVWALITRLYVARRPARWTVGGHCSLEGSQVLAFSNHSMENVYFDWARGRLPTEA